MIILRGKKGGFPPLYETHSWKKTGVIKLILGVRFSQKRS